MTITLAAIKILENLVERTDDHLSKNLRPLFQLYIHLEGISCITLNQVILNA